MGEDVALEGRAGRAEGEGLAGHGVGFQEEREGYPESECRLGRAGERG